MLVSEFVLVCLVIMMAFNCTSRYSYNFDDFEVCTFARYSLIVICLHHDCVLWWCIVRVLYSVPVITSLSQSILMPLK